MVLDPNQGCLIACPQRLPALNSPYQVFQTRDVQHEALLPFIMPIGHGKGRRSGITDAFGISRPAGHHAVFVAQQFCELAIDVHNESFIGQLAGGVAGGGPLEQHVGRFIPVCQ